MEDIIGFLIFLIIVAISIISKTISQKKEISQENDLPVPPTILEDLPESTRRILFGDRETDIKVAKPKQPDELERKPSLYPEGEGPSKPTYRHVTEEPPSQQKSPTPVPARRIPLEGPVVVRTPPVDPLRKGQGRPFQEKKSTRAQGTKRVPGRSKSREVSLRTAGTPQKKLEPPVMSSKPSGTPPSILGEPRRKKLQEALYKKENLKQSVLLLEILGPPKAFDR